MQLQDLLFTQGFGTRRICAGLVQRGLVALQQQDDDDVDAQARWLICDDPAVDVQEDGMRFMVQGQVWEYHRHAYIAMHKPTGVECSQKPSAYPSVYSLLPAPLRQRPAKGAVQGVQAIGRLDQDTTGLLLLSDDGQFIHRMSSPKKQVPKVYRVTAKHPVTDAQIERLLAGVVLDDDPRPVQAAECERREDHVIDLTLTSGKYHQVKRMLAAVGNRVEALHRSRIGGLQLPPDLALGAWCWLYHPQLELLRQA